MTASLSLSPLAVWAIEFYQRYLSPLKGFRCAHRARKHGRTSSCSQFAKRAFARFGIFAGATLMNRRFDRCAASARALENEPQKKRTEAKRQWDCGDPVPSCDVTPMSCDGCGAAADVVPDVPCDCSL